MSYLEIVCRVTLGVTFLAAAVGKARDRSAFQAFTDSLRMFERLPARLRPAAGVATIAVELSIVALLVWRTTVPAGLVLAAVTLVVFTAAMASVERRGGHATCRCFGGSDEWGRSQVVRNLLLTVLALLGLPALALAPVAAPLAAAALTAVIAATATLALLHVKDIAYVFR
ncbi:MauE/DoxX family redox-associated membrane protein [Actinoplanes solisilvae]|uniref:MauE/DoxX family redox-associated membrane protein n=1 Tax=Actinoplanes solisilvae TaxID=2486853 RepID=UPI000FD8A3BD|nr:MauE/DoxX family redox-associated membrane protein [Actinoplanes solisilvae]